MLREQVTCDLFGPPNGDIPFRHNESEWGTFDYNGDTYAFHIPNPQWIYKDIIDGRSPMGEDYHWLRVCKEFPKEIRWAIEMWAQSGNSLPVWEFLNKVLSNE
jgi:hypothetical protein